MVLLQLALTAKSSIHLACEARNMDYLNLEVMQNCNCTKVMNSTLIGSVPPSLNLNTLQMSYKKSERLLVCRMRRPV